ncbi:MAG: SIS domain-containing protein [Candidatus Neomarinimicrobiota bacterium]
METDGKTTLHAVRRQLAEAAEIMEQMKGSCGDDIVVAARMITDTVKNGGKVLWCGNGGSAAQAQHLSTELVGGLRDHRRPPIASVSLTTDSSLLTAWSNDLSFETVFSRQVEALGRRGDILLAISTSGNSSNILKAVETARTIGIGIIILTGREGGKLKDRGDLVIHIPSSDTQRIQEGHIAAGHIICELVERAFMRST